MRLAFITPEFVTEPSYAGGLANYLGRVTAALAGRGHDVHVLVPAPVDETIDYQGVRVHRVLPVWDKRMILDRVDRFFMNDLYNPYQEMKAAWCFWRHWTQLRRAKPFDLVQVANVSAAGLFFRREATVPVITRMSSYRPLWDTLAATQLHRGQRWRWTLEEWATRGTKYVYAPTDFVARQVQEKYRLPKVDVIETPFFPEQPSEDDSVYQQSAFFGKPYLLFFGRMTQMKGVHILAQALPGLLQQLPEAHAVLIGGSDPPAPDGRPMRDYVADQTASVSDRVHLLDPLPHSQLYPIVRRARVVVIPSLVDNMPNTCLEAMGLGRIVVATTGSCFEQLIAHGESGLLSPPNDVAGLGRMLHDAWSLDDARREQMERRAAARIAELHPDRTVPRLLDYYEQVIADFQKRRLSA